jgi:hypothetical protein
LDLGGDLNIILNLEEKRGGTRRLEHDSSQLYDLLEEKHLIDIEPRMPFSLGPTSDLKSQQIACRLD